MRFTTFFTCAAVPFVALASPIAVDLEARAGGPAFTPIPANCTLMNPLPHASQHPGNGSVSGYVPSTSALTSQIYSWYLSQPDFMAPASRWESCIEQCNGLSGCSSAFMAYNAPTPKGYYGTQGGVMSVGCMMFNRTLTPLDFVAATEGQYVNATAGNIYCPGAAASNSTKTVKRSPIKLVV